MNGGFLEALAANLAAPAPLFFLLGLVAAIARSDLRLPEPLYASMTVYLLAAIGFKGGVALSGSSLAAAAPALVAALVLASAVPLWTYPLLRQVGRLSAVDAASISGHYGSVSAVTFTVATSFLASIGVEAEGHAPAWLALMESPAILIAIVLGNRASGASSDAGASAPNALRHVLRDAVLGKSVVLLVGSLCIGWASGDRGMATVGGLFAAPFQGVLALFLLELGLVAGRRLGDLRRVGPFLFVFAIVAPLVNGFAGAWAGNMIGLSIGGATLLATLAASASYIAAPAALRVALPQANPTLSLTASLVVTFPFNVAFGVPLYHSMASWLARGA